VVSLIKAEEGRRIVMFDVPNIEGDDINNRNLSDAMNGAEVVKTERKNSLKMICFVTIATRQVIQRRPTGKSMENHQG
jgi:hypothetical protein